MHTREAREPMKDHFYFDFYNKIILTTTRHFSSTRWTTENQEHFHEMKKEFQSIKGRLETVNKTKS